MKPEGVTDKPSEGTNTEDSGRTIVESEKNNGMLTEGAKHDSDLSKTAVHEAIDKPEGRETERAQETGESVDDTADEKHYKLTESVSGMLQGLFGNKAPAEAELAPAPAEVPQPVEQVETLTLDERFKKLSGRKISSLSADEQKELVNIAVDNMQEKYGDKIPAARFEKIRKSISFIDGDTAVARGDLEEDEKDSVLGYYTPGRDDIVINTTADDSVDGILTTLDHEAMHMGTQRFSLWGPDVTGVETRRNELPDGNVGMNEGLTEMYSIRNVKTLTPGYVSNSYTKNVALMEKFEGVFGANELKNAYLTNDFKAIESDFDRYMGKGSFVRFCAEMDRMHDDLEEGRRLSGAQKYCALLAEIDNYANKKRGTP